MSNIPLEDTQQAALYKAESIFLFTRERPDFMHLSDCQGYINRLKKHSQLVELYPQLFEIIQKTKLEDSTDDHATCLFTWYTDDNVTKEDVLYFTSKDVLNLKMHDCVLLLPFLHRSRWEICHELAHALAYYLYGTYTIENHGCQFARIYLDLIRYGMSETASTSLELSYMEHNIQYEQNLILA